MSERFSNRLKELRSSKGYTQKEFANLLGVGQGTVANYEKGSRVPDTGKLNKIADIYDVSLDFLLGREDTNSTEAIEDKNNIANNSVNFENHKMFLECLLNGEKESGRAFLINLQNSGIKLKDIYLNILEKALKEVGELWEKGTIDVWKEHYISEAIFDFMRELKIRENKLSGKAPSLMALTAGPELHNIGLKMITDLLELEGWSVNYLGSNIPVQSVIKAIEVEKPKVIAISVTIPFHIDSAKNLITAIKIHFGKRTPKIIVGGGAFINCRNVCEDTGADYYGLKVEDISRIIG